MSAGSRLIRLAIGEYGASAEYILERSWERREDFLLLNPEGTLPVLIDEDDVPVSGAATVCEYLDETRGFTLEDRRLMPSHPLARAEVRRLMHWFLVKMESEATQYFVNEKVTKREKPRDAGGGAPESSVLRAARANLRNHLAKTWYSRIKCRPAFREILADKIRGIPPPAHYTDLDF